MKSVTTSALLIKMARSGKCLLITLLIMIAISNEGSAQLYKDQWLIGGSGSFSYSRAKLYNDIMKSSSIAFSPAAGYFFFDRFAGGLRIDLSRETYRDSPNYKTRNTITSFGPFIRYYFLSQEHKINLLADAGYGFNYGKYTNFTDVVYRYHSGTLSFKAGPAFFLNEHTALELTLGYNHSTRGPIDTAVTNTIRLGIGLQIHFGKKRD